MFMSIQIYIPATGGKTSAKLAKKVKGPDIMTRPLSVRFQQTARSYSKISVIRRDVLYLGASDSIFQEIDCHHCVEHSVGEDEG